MSDHDFKEKPKRRARQFPVDFVIPLQLEECIYRIEHVPEEPENADLRFTAWYPEWHSADVYSAEFTVSLNENGSPVGTAGGTIERWEGTSTRLKGQYESEQGINLGTLRRWLISWFPVNTLLCSVGLISAFTSPEYSLSIAAITLMAYAAINVASLNLVGRHREHVRLKRIADYIKTIMMVEPETGD